MVSMKEYVSSPLEPTDSPESLLREKIELLLACFDEFHDLKDDRENFTENLAYIKKKATVITENMSDSITDMSTVVILLNNRIQELKEENAELRDSQDQYKQLSETYLEHIEKLKNYVEETETENNNLTTHVDALTQELNTNTYYKKEVENELEKIIESVQEENRQLRSQIETSLPIDPPQNYERSIATAETPGKPPNQLDNLLDEYQSYKSNAEKNQQHLQESLNRLKQQLKAAAEHSMQIISQENNIRNSYKNKRKYEKRYFSSHANAETALVRSETVPTSAFNLVSHTAINSPTIISRRPKINVAIKESATMDSGRVIRLDSPNLNDLGAKQNSFVHFQSPKDISDTDGSEGPKSGIMNELCEFITPMRSKRAYLLDSAYRIDSPKIPKSNFHVYTESGSVEMQKEKLNESIQEQKSVEIVQEMHRKDAETQMSAVPRKSRTYRGKKNVVKVSDMGFCKTLLVFFIYFSLQIMLGGLACLFQGIRPRSRT